MSQLNGSSRDSQKTIAKSITLSGIGIHSGKPCNVEFSPANIDSGLFFILNNKKIPANVGFVTSTDRGTALSNVHVVEHILAAAYGLGIDNLEIKLSSPESPIMDGSALPFVAALKQAGIINQNKIKKLISIPDKIRVFDGDSCITALPFDGFRVHFMIDFPYIGTQEFTYIGNFEEEIAPARTFGLIEEVECLKSQGLAIGASIDNALAIGQSGYVNAPRFPNEPVRHKILDLIGDLALIGSKINGEFIARKSGHKLNIELARRLVDLCLISRKS